MDLRRCQTRSLFRSWRYWSSKRRHFFYLSSTNWVFATFEGQLVHFMLIDNLDDRRLIDGGSLCSNKMVAAVGKCVQLGILRLGYGCQRRCDACFFNLTDFGPWYRLLLFVNFPCFRLRICREQRYSRRTRPILWFDTFLELLRVSRSRLRYLHTRRLDS